MADDASRVEIGAVLRQDATGTWHRATWSGRVMTVRILREDLAERADARLLFEEEMRRVERLDHSALLRVHKTGRSASRPWMLTDPIDGGTLAEALPAEGLGDADAALLLVRSLHEGFRYLQDRKQVHAAPWPLNVVRVGGGWRLTTFRSIRAWDELGSLKGKKDAHADWTPPERARANPAALKPEPWISWSVGVLLQALLGPGAAEPWPAVIASLTAADPAVRPLGRRAVGEALEGRVAAPGQADAQSSAPSAPRYRVGGVDEASPCSPRRHILRRSWGRRPACRPTSPAAS